MKTIPKSLQAILSRWLPPLIWASLIYAFSSRSQITISQLFFWDFLAKKAAHLTEYAILFALIFRATRGKWSSSWLLLLAYAVFDEFHQSLVPGRNATPLDVGFDLMGASIASFIIWKKLHQGTK